MKYNKRYDKIFRFAFFNLHFDFCNYGKSCYCCVKTAYQWVFGTKKAVFLWCLSLLFLGEGIGEGRSLSSLPNPHYSDELPYYISPLIEKVKHIVYPVMGFPTIVVAGESLTAVVSLDDGGKTSDWAMKISTHHSVRQTYTLNTVECGFDGSGYYTVTGVVPHQVPREVFDLVITSENSGISDSQPNAVRVINESRHDYRFVHVTDLHIGGPRGCLVPRSDENSRADTLDSGYRIFNELSFLDPEFILFSGDLLFGGSYLLEYLWAWEILSSFSLPIFMVSGNHDGYASGWGLLGDGLEYWKQMIAPPSTLLTMGTHTILPV